MKFRKIGQDRHHLLNIVSHLLSWEVTKLIQWRCVKLRARLRKSIPGVDGARKPSQMVAKPMIWGPVRVWEERPLKYIFVSTTELRAQGNHTCILHACWYQVPGPVLTASVIMSILQMEELMVLHEEIPGWVGSHPSPACLGNLHLLFNTNIDMPDSLPLML